MEKIGCPKYGGAIETPVAAEYFKDDTICGSCRFFDVCKEATEEQDGKREG